MIERVSGVSRRSAARLAAIQALYEIDLVGVAAASVLREFLESRWCEAIPIEQIGSDAQNTPELPKPEKRFLERIVYGVTSNIETLDKAIAPQLNSPWAIDQLDTLVRAILRAGAFEFTQCPEVRARIVISEYVGLAHAFFSENEPAFINGVLDSLASQCRSNEFTEKTL